MQPKTSRVVFLTFWGLSCTVLYNRTVVSQPGAWEVRTGFPTERGSCLGSCYGCRLFSQCAPSTVCVGELGIVVGQIWKQTGLAGLRGERDIGQEPLFSLFTHTHTHTLSYDLQISQTWGLDKHHSGGTECKEFWETTQCENKHAKHNGRKNWSKL